jgi:hypothetical protein
VKRDCEGALTRIPHFVLEAIPLHDGGDRRIVRMWNTREEMMLDLEVEPPEQPRQDAVVRTEIDGRLYFVNRPDATLGDQLVARDEGCLRNEPAETSSPSPG